MSPKKGAYRKDLGNKDFRDNFDRIFRKGGEMPKKKEVPKKQSPKKRGSKPKKSY